MFQLQMTGYMFRNAEYRLSLSESLKGSGILPGDLANEDVVDVAERVKDKTKVKGQVKVTLKDGTTLEVDADAYVAELRGEVDKLRGQLARIKETREEAAKTDLVAYINSLPRDEMQVGSQEWRVGRRDVAVADAAFDQIRKDTTFYTPCHARIHGRS